MAYLDPELVTLLRKKIEELIRQPIKDIYYAESYGVNPCAEITLAWDWKLGNGLEPKKHQHPADLY